jgi:hypothetical protein
MAKTESLDGTPKAMAKLNRNHEKLREAIDNERVLRIRATDSLNSVTLRRDNLCQLATQLVNGTVRALSLSLAQVPGDDILPDKISGKNPFDPELSLDLDMSSVSTGSPHDCLAPLRSPPQPKWTKQIKSENGSKSNSSTDTGTPGDSEAHTPKGLDFDLPPGANPFDDFEAPPPVLNLCLLKKPPVRGLFRPPPCLAWCRPG